MVAGQVVWEDSREEVHVGDQEGLNVHAIDCGNMLYGG